MCGGHGDYKNGECECHPGWKGKECSLRHDECEVADCSGKFNVLQRITKIFEIRRPFALLKNYVHEPNFVILSRPRSVC